MSVILKALRREKNPTQQSVAAPQAEGFHWADSGKAQSLQPASRKTLLILVMVLAALCVLSVLSWWYSQHAQQATAGASEQAAVKPEDTTAAKKSREKVAALIQSGRAAYEAGQMDVASSQFEKALEIDPQNAQLRNDLGLVYLKRQLLDKSAAQLKMALRLDAGCAQCANNLGYLKTLQLQMNDAEKLLKQAADIDPNYPDPYFNLGVLYEKNGDLGNATAAYRAFLGRVKDAANPTAIEVQKHLKQLDEEQ